MNIINNLRYDHEVILTGLNASKKLLKQKDPNFLVVFEKLCHLIEGIHHFAEEEILFKPLLKEVFFYAGGPRCTHFKELKLLQNPVASIEVLIGKKREQLFSTEALFSPTYHPLSIPVSEHRACHEITKHIWREWNVKGQNTLACFEAYENILREHIEKEEGCLFEMLIQNVDQITLNKMAQLYQLKANEVEPIQKYFKQF